MLLPPGHGSIARWYATEATRRGMSKNCDLIIWIVTAVGIS